MFERQVAVYLQKLKQLGIILLAAVSSWEAKVLLDGSDTRLTQRLEQLLIGRNGGCARAVS